MTMPKTRDEREMFLNDQIERLVDGITYARHYRDGRAQVMLSPEGAKGLTKIEALVSLEREEE